MSLRCFSKCHQPAPNSSLFTPSCMVPGRRNMHCVSMAWQWVQSSHLLTCQSQYDQSCCYAGMSAVCSERTHMDWTVRRRWSCIIQTTLWHSCELTPCCPQCSSASTSAGVGSLVGTTGGQAPSSSQLLARMHNRQQGINQEAAAGTEPEALAQQITKDLVQYLNGHGGSAPSAEIINHFRHVGERHAALFRQLLKHLATLQRTADGSKLWTLKPEFVPDS